MDDYVTTDEVARRLNVKVETVRRWVRLGKLPGLPLGRAGYRITEADFAAFVRQHVPHHEEPGDVVSFAGPSFLPLLEAISDSFAVLDRTWRYLYVNDAVCQMVNRPRIDLIGHVVWEVFPVLIGGPFERAVRTAVASGQPVPCEYYSEVAGRWVRAQIYPATGWVSIYWTDIQERKETEEALARLASIVNSSQDAIISITLDGLITSWNAAASRLYGYEAAEMLGKSVMLIIPEEQRAEYAYRVERLRAGERTDYLETMRQRKDGTRLTVSFNLSPLYNLQGELVGAASVAHDISERVQIEAALLASEQRFRATFEQAAVGIAHVAPDGRWLAVNQRLCDLVGYSRAELLAGSFQDVTFPEDLETDLTYVQQLLAGERQTYAMEKRYVRRDGSLIWINLTVSLVRDANGAPLYFISVVEDIGERKRLERLRDEFLAMASHELRTPVTSLKGFTSLLKRRMAAEADETSFKYLLRMEGQLNRLNRLIEDLLDLSRVQLGQLPMQDELVDLVALVREVVELAQATTRKTLHMEETLEKETDDGGSILVRGDQAHLAQVFHSLLVNAIKYSPQADRVEIRLFTEERMAVVQVQDFGIGIAPEYHAHLFERFYQVPDPVAKTFPGMGIGLYLAHDIVTSHEGRIEVESRAGEGATFTVRLPLAPPAAKGAAIPHERSNQSA